MDILTLADRVRDGAYRSDRFPAVPFIPLSVAMRDAQAVMAASAEEWAGTVTPACDDRSRTEVVTRQVGIGLRIGGEASLCFACGPDGGHYHPTEGESMDSVMAVASRLAGITERSM